MAATGVNMILNTTSSLAVISNFWGLWHTIRLSGSCAIISVLKCYLFNKNIWGFMASRYYEADGPQIIRSWKKVVIECEIIGNHCYSVCKLVKKDLAEPEIVWLSPEFWFVQCTITVWVWILCFLAKTERHLVLERREKKSAANTNSSFSYLQLFHRVLLW